MIRILLTVLLGMVVVGFAASGVLSDQDTRSTDPQAILDTTWQKDQIFP